MSDEIRVSIASYGAGRCLMMTYKDPITGKKIAKTSGTTDRTQAERAAAVWQDELNSGRYQAPSRLTWADFRKRYESEKLAGLAPKTRETAGEALDYLEKIINPDRLTKLTATAMSRFQSELRKPRERIRGGKKIIKPAMKDTTIARHLRHVRAALSWAVSMGLLPKVPEVHMPKRVKGQTLMRGRAIAGEEFDRMVAAVPKVQPDGAAAWVHYLTGLWLSGLRLEESIALSWDQDAPFYADLTGRRPSFRIYGEAQKSGRDEVLPMTPDFAQFLAETPEAERVGPVFKLPALRNGQPKHPREIGRIVSVIGRMAGVVVNKADGKFASAHDLRRAFGTRWAKRVMPAVLRRLMRHASIGTTMGYYVDLDSADVADQLWASYGNTPAAGNTAGNTRPQEAENKESPATVTDCRALPYDSEGDGNRTRNHRIDSPVL